MTVLDDGILPGIVASQNQAQIVAKYLEQKTEIFRAPMYVLGRVVGIGHSISCLR